ncbi:MAG: leucine-rich repeat domain-containing protein [Acidobacteriota bacterium]
MREIIDFYAHDLESLSDDICDHVDAHTLLVANNRLTALPSCLARLTNLRTLDAGHNRIVKVPELPEITDFLYLHDNRIRSLSFRSLGRLRYLNLGDNPLAPLTEDIAAMASLEELRLENSRLTSLPEAIGRLAQLTELALRDNSLATLPESMRGLGRLTHLDLRGNGFRELPAFLAELPRLLKLDLRWNRALVLPPWVDALRERGCRVLF